MEASSHQLPSNGSISERDDVEEDDQEGIAGGGRWSGAAVQCLGPSRLSSRCRTDRGRIVKTEFICLPYQTDYETRLMPAKCRPSS